MSADLLAEFGPPRPGTDEHAKKERQSVSLQPNKTLVPALVDASLPCEEKTDLHNLWCKENNGTEVLFDCSTDQFDSNDEFGDFEYGEQEIAQSTSSSLTPDTTREKTTSAAVIPSQALLDLEGSVESSEMFKCNESQHIEEEWGDFTAAISKEEPKPESMNSPRVSSKSLQAVTIDKTANEDRWEPFEDGEMAESTQYTNNQDGRPTTHNGTNGTSSQPVKQPRELSSTDRASAIPSEDESRPTNIPLLQR